MVQTTAAPEIAIGACLNCRQLFLVTPGTRTCLICGHPPELTLPFRVAQPEPAEEPLLSPLAAAEPPEVTPRDTVGAELILLDLIIAYLDDGGVTEEAIASCLMQMGAEPEAASTAAGRLQAVRDLIRDIGAFGSEASVSAIGPTPAEEEPEPESEYIPHTAPDEEPDRTTASSL